MKFNHSKLSRRSMLSKGGAGLGLVALDSVFGQEARLALPAPHHAPRAKSMIQLFMCGGPSQLEMFEHKPKLQELDGKPVPASLLKGRRFAFLDNAKVPIRMLGTRQKFERHGQSGMSFSDLVPHMGGIADEICVLRGVVTEVINHGPAKVFFNTGSRLPGRPSMGSWLLHGLGSQCPDLPGYVVLLSGPRGPNGGSTLWTSGFLSSRFQGVPLRHGSNPILDLKSPPGFDHERQKAFFEAVHALNMGRPEALEDDELRTRVAAYSMAQEMQRSAPELTDISDEPQSILDLYGVTPGEPSFALNCLLARRMIERGVRFVQLYHPDWDHHGLAPLSLGEPLAKVCKQVDRSSAALVIDLKQRGLLDETLVMWGGEFGRTPMLQDGPGLGRDHHIDAATMWLAGGGVKAGFEHGQTDELGFSVESGRVHLHDLHATILHLMGLDHLKLTTRFQGRDFRLTDVAGEVVHDILA